MRPLVLSLGLALIVALASSASHAQARADLPGQQAPVSVYASPETPTLKQLFNAQTLRVSQSYEFSYAGGGAGTMGLGVYTASLRWQPTAQLAGRVDLGVAHSPFSSGLYESALGANSEQPRVFLRNAELAWKPTENSMVRFQVQQSPYGAYASPYGTSAYGAGRYAPYGSSFGAQVGSSGSDALFWRDQP
jgi:hypothetical protein